jgi:hypothetical protein
MHPPLAISKIQETFKSCRSVGISIRDASKKLDLISLPLLLPSPDHQEKASKFRQKNSRIYHIGFEISETAKSLGPPIQALASGRQ